MICGPCANRLIRRILDRILTTRVSDRCLQNSLVLGRWVILQKDVLRTPEAPRGKRRNLRYFDWWAKLLIEQTTFLVSRAKNVPEAIGERYNDGLKVDNDNTLLRRPSIELYISFTERRVCHVAPHMTRSRDAWQCQIANDMYSIPYSYLQLLSLIIAYVYDIIFHRFISSVQNLGVTPAGAVRAICSTCCIVSQTLEPRGCTTSELNNCYNWAPLTVPKPTSFS